MCRGGWDAQEQILSTSKYTQSVCQMYNLNLPAVGRGNDDGIIAVQACFKY